MSEPELLSSRVLRLEKGLRRIKMTAVLGCILLAAMAVMAQVRTRPGDVLPGGRLIVEQPPRPAPAVENEVRAHQIILLDYNGKERASLVADNAGSVFLIMSDRNGKTRINLFVSNDGPALTFLDPAGQARTILGSTTAVPSHVNDNGIAEVAPPSSIVFFDRNGKLLFRTP